MSNQLQLAVHGAAGRMGQRVVALAAEDSDIEIVAAIEHSENRLLGNDAGLIAGISALDISLTDAWPNYAAVVIDFSLPVAADGCIANCVAAKIPLVMATTGLTEIQKQSLEEASKSIPIVFAPSMSMAVNLTMKLTQQITETLKGVPGGLDIEILERHHRFKADAPSGTAIKFGELIAEKMDGDVKHVHGREGETGQRTRGEIGYHAIRVGDNPGEHTIVFGMMGERIEMNVAASNRDCYASGAIVAAKWLQDKPAGLYNMFDVLGL
ncbi:4-hydroxy-tetrahydrodipicolinate reductase [Rubripirellula obstinata]|uniref:4-hydroxy-tetrahydrodipicolinate reductase n=1 Tax=Rubripirellula obstinata TaxID=406547 RepID=A0A5B1CIR4_9BACT|nr:4-hydroxy-tetrahydrodipicolinate reductase [Rubripirellula obstinata]KAA1260486.1 4-hydroxy-tetrahydrodipicolinate reductase [Rubripirellula obstinata]